MVCIFHKWGKWSKPLMAKMKSINRLSGQVEYGRSMVQERFCEKCGKYQWRMV